MKHGVANALLSATLFGISAAVAKVLLAAVSPQTLAGLLYLGSGSGLLILRLVHRSAETPSEASLQRGDLKWLASAILVGGVFGPLLLLSGLARTPASAASLLLNLESVFTAVLAWIVFRENTDRRIVLGMAAIVAGGALLSWQGALGWGGISGPLLIAGATFCWGIDNNLTQKISASDPLQIATLKGLVAGSVNLAIGLVSTRGLFAPATIGAALLLGFFSYGVSLTLFIKALRDLGTARTGAYFSLAPFVGALASFIIWRDALTPLFVAAAALMGLGLYIHLTERHQHVHVHEPITHAHLHTHDAHHRHAHSPDDPAGEPHVHAHKHEPIKHEHPHYPDLHHRHGH